MTIEEVRAHFEADKYLMLTGVEIDEVAEDYAVCSLEISDKHKNATGAVQGGVTYTLADSAFAVASNYGFLDRGEPYVTVSQSASVTYFKPPKGKRLIVKAHKLSGGRKVSVYEMDVTDDLGTKIALVIGHGYVVNISPKAD